MIHNSIPFILNVKVQKFATYISIYQVKIYQRNI